jgi:type 1 fimbriae regulatory protein FimB/type 1 fimbriae regulatory protein FimE
MHGTFKRIMPTRTPNAEMRSREYLTESEIRLLMSTALDGNNGTRDAAMILIGYRHGLRAAELVALRWDQFDFEQGTVAVRRVKKGTPSTQPLQDDEIELLQKLRQTASGRYLFVTRFGTPFTTDGFAKLVDRLGQAAGLPFKAHPHMLRHACGFTLANKGHDTRAIQGYLGHRDIKHTVVYTELAAGRFDGFWK